MFGRPPFPTGPRAFLSYWHVSPQSPISKKVVQKKTGLNSAGCRRRTTISANSSNLDIKMMGAMDPTGSQLWNLMDSKSMTIVTIPFEHILVTFFSCKMVYTTWKPEETTPVLVTKETKYCEGHFFERGDYATWQQLLKSPGVWSHFAGAKRYNEVATVEAFKILKVNGMNHQKISYHQLPIYCNCVIGCLSLVLQDFLPEEWCWQHKRTKIKALEVAFCVFFSVKIFGSLQSSRFGPMPLTCRVVVLAPPDHDGWSSTTPMCHGKKECSSDL